MTTLHINSRSAQAKGFLAYAATLPFVKIADDVPAPKLKNFEEESRKCNAMSLDEFGDELHRRLTEYYKNDAKS